MCVWGGTSERGIEETENRWGVEAHRPVCVVAETDLASNRIHFSARTWAWSVGTGPASFSLEPQLRGENGPGDWELEEGCTEH